MVDIKLLVDVLVEQIFGELPTTRPDLDQVWADAWERIIDELKFTHGISINPKMPAYPQFIEQSKDLKLEIKRILVEELKKRIGGQ